MFFISWSRPAVAADALLKEDFQSFSAGETVPVAAGPSPGTWFFQPLRGDREATFEKSDSGERFLSVRQGMEGTGRGSWHLYRMLDKTPASGEPFALEVKFRFNSADLPFDWIFGPTDQDFRKVPGNANLLTIFRVQNSTSAGRVNFRYWRPDLKGGEGAYTSRVPGSALEPGVWYRLRAVIRPKDSVMSLQLAAADGSVLLDEPEVPLQLSAGEVAGVAFKNRTAELNSADFDLAEVSMESGPSLAQ